MDKDDFDYDETINMDHYVSSFNQGYVIAEHDLELATRLRDGLIINSDSDLGLLDGLNQYFLEKEANRASELEEIRDSETAKDYEVEQDEPKDELTDNPQMEKSEEEKRLDELDSLREEEPDRDLDEEREI